MMRGLPRRPSAGQVVLGALCAMYFLFYMDRVDIATAATSIQHELHLSNTQLGLVFSAFAYPYAFFQIFGGWIADRFGPRRTLMACGLIVSATTMLTGLVGALGSLFAVRMALGFGEGAAFPTATRAMASWLPPSRWGYGQGITHSASRLGNALTPPLISALILALSWRASFVIVGAASLVWVVFWAVWFHDEPATHPRVTEVELRALGGARQKRGQTPTPWRALILRMLPVTAVDFCYGWMLWLFLNWLPSFFQNEYHQDLKKSAFFSAGVFLAGLVGDTLGGVLSDRILKHTGDLQRARAWVITGGFLGACICMTPLFLTANPTLVAVTLGCAFFALELIVAPIWSVPMDIAPAHAGKASGMMNLGFGIAGIISPFVVGEIIDITGSRTLPFIVSMSLLPLGAVLAFRMHPDLPLST
ncbi:MFS transporter [Rhodopila sp.]|uniref:MFS transporter n=1 Tax=Rhodopila sp. TaxID=2480087 RepID=UPI003D13F7CD